MRRKGVLFKSMMVVLLGSLAFTGWVWLAPYEWNADEEARFRIESARLQRDRSYHWLLVHLKARRGAEGHDWSKRVFLETGSGRKHEPADTTLAGHEGGRQELWLKFWLEEDDLAGRLRLRVNDGSLLVKSREGIPATGSSGVAGFSNHRW